MKISPLRAFLVFSVSFFLQSTHIDQQNRIPSDIIVFTKTVGFRHKSIPQATGAMKALAKRYGYTLIHTEDSRIFTPSVLESTKAIVFLLTTGDVIPEAFQANIKNYVEQGGGFVGVHSASDTEYQWPWYKELIGTYFKQHPKIQSAIVSRSEYRHHSSEHLPKQWSHIDEWYNFSNPLPPKILLSVDENTYEGGLMGNIHPISWCHEIKKGRSWYTALGHTKESYKNPLLLKHLWGGVEYAMGVVVSPCRRSLQ
ncbi:MAG: ThuA domain-containing protein [Bdellovibrionales bacterium]|nr:ThuA domain-containing protein [Bdellovibrionales bacterium]